jgi:hypothetical protein
MCCGPRDTPALFHAVTLRLSHEIRYKFSSDKLFWIDGFTIAVEPYMETADKSVTRT